MIDVIIADHQELFRIGLADVLAVVDDVRIVGQAVSRTVAEHIEKGQSPRIDFVNELSAAFSKIQRNVEAEQDCTARAR